MTVEINLSDEDWELPSAEDWRRPIPVGEDWISTTKRPPELGIWVEVYESQKGRLRVARLLEADRWEFENGERTRSVLKWRDPELPIRSQGIALAQQEEAESNSALNL